MATTIDFETVFATDTETQITAAVPEDNKVISRSKLFNWWAWIKSQAQIIHGSWTFSDKVAFAVGTATSPSLIIPDGILTSTPQNGAMEATKENLYYTFGGVRHPVFSENLYDGSSLSFLKWSRTDDVAGTFTDHMFALPDAEQSWFSLGGNRILMKTDLFISRNYFDSSFKLTAIRIVLTSQNKAPSESINVGTINLVEGSDNVLLPMEWSFSLLQRGYYFYLACKYKNYSNLTKDSGIEETKIARLDGYSTTYDWGDVAWKLDFYMDYTIETVPSANEQVFIAELLSRTVKSIL